MLQVQERDKIRETVSPNSSTGDTSKAFETFYCRLSNDVDMSSSLCAALNDDEALKSATDQFVVKRRAEKMSFPRISLFSKAENDFALVEWIFKKSHSTLRSLSRSADLEETIIKLVLSITISAQGFRYPNSNFLHIVIFSKRR